MLFRRKSACTHIIPLLVEISRKFTRGNLMDRWIRIIAWHVGDRNFVCTKMPIERSFYRE